MSLDQPACPTCGTALTKTTNGQLDTWVCGRGHGLAMTLDEAHGRIQNDEIAEIWAKAKAASPGERPCPMCGLKMVKVDVTVDADEVPDGQPGDGPDAATVEIDVCRQDELLWFDTGELDQFPADLPDPGPSPDEQAKIAQITQAFGQAIVQEARDEDGHGPAGHLYNHMAKYTGLTGFASRWLR